MEMSEPTDSPASLAPLLDDSSADVTSQLPAAETTVTDLDAFASDAPDAPDAMNAAGAPNAPNAPNAVDATGEIEALDILEVVEVLRASRVPVAPVAEAPLAEAPAAEAPVAEVPFAPPASEAFHASSVPCAPPSSRAAEVLETSRLPAVIIDAPQPSLPSIPMTMAAPRGHHPSSIAPLALDVTPPPRSYASASWRTPTPPDPRESTVEIARAAGIPSRASRIVVFTASVVGMCLVAGILGVMLGYSHGPASKAQPTSLAGPGPVAPGLVAPGPVATSAVATSTVATGPAPRVAVVTGAHEEITEGPILVPGKDASSIFEADEIATATPMALPSAAPTPLAVAAPAPRSAAPAAPVTRAPAPAPRSPSSSGGGGGGSASAGNASNSSTGVLRLPATVSGVLIDGVPHKAGGGGLVVACGRHTVKAPGHPSRLVIIPCGGSAAL